MEINYLKMPDDIPENDLFKKMVTVSVVLHVSIFLIFSVKALLFPSETLNIDSAIRVDIVDLPDKLQALPEKPAAPESPAQPKPPSVTVPAETKATIPKEIPKAEPVVIYPKDTVSKNTEKDSALKRIEKFKKEQQRQKMLEDIENQVKQEEAKEKTARVAKIKAALLKGNSVSPGTALKGPNKVAFNDYKADVMDHVKSHWDLPEWMKSANLHAVVRVNIDHRGVVIKRIIEKSSGDKIFDDYALKAIDNSSPFPKPPDKFVDLFQVDGFSFGLNP